jgi:carboxypeptidase Taq
VLDALKAQLVPLVKALAGREPRHALPSLFDGSRTYADAAQWALTLDVLASMGFDFKAGRQDRSIHPFTGGSHPRDVRLTTRLEAGTPVPAFFGALHEGGHGLFEQGFAEGDFRTPLAASPSMGLHESQSRLWENQVGRGQPFWRHWYPRFQAAFPEALAGVPEASFHAEVNRVQPSFIRVEADEVTYNLHVILRYELELLLLRDALPLSELPGAWNARMAQYLGITPPDPVKGVLRTSTGPGASSGTSPPTRWGTCTRPRSMRRRSGRCPRSSRTLPQGTCPGCAASSARTSMPPGTGCLPRSGCAR